jgi:chromosome segregation ATPase
MLKVALGFVAAVIVTLALFQWYRHANLEREHQEQQIAQLNSDIARLHTDNERLKAELAKVQNEEARLAANNEELRKAIEQARLTGKIPKVLPYPPK